MIDRTQNSAARARAAGRRACGAFTLVELMVSITLALLLMFAVHHVFRMTADTVGAGQALAGCVRDYRAAQSVMYADLATAVMPYAVGGSTLEDAPFFLIRSERITMFRNAEDQSADRDGDPATLEINDNNVEGEAAVPGETVRNTDVSERSHRLDRLMFFGRGHFPRLTGGDLTASGGQFVADMTSEEAFIWYGHLKLPDRSTASGDARRFAPRRPGEVVPPATIAERQTRNPDNFFAADWVLGRSAILLLHGTDTNDDDIGDVLTDRNGTPQAYLSRVGGPGGTFLAPLHSRFRNARVRSSEAGGAWELEWSRFDVANTSIAQYRQVLADYMRARATIPWNAWFEGMQFEADPTPDRPLTATGVARTFPVLLPHCSNFLVEYAGDFVTQDADPIRGSATPAEDGTVLNTSPDGILDFVRLADGSRRTRWYGLPRDTDGDGRVPGGRPHNNQMPDVVPLRDVRRTAATPPAAEAAPFERLEDEGGLTGGARTRLPLPSSDDYSTSMPPDARYVVAWGPDTEDQPRPRMLRIVFTVDDPKGKLRFAQTYTYVVRLP